MTQYRFIGVQTERSADSDSPRYVRTYVYDSDLKEYASFGSGGPVADFEAVKEFCERSQFDGVYVISSSVDDLVFDVPGYRFDPNVGGYGAVVVDENDDRPVSGKAPATPQAPRI